MFHANMVNASAAAAARLRAFSRKVETGFLAAPVPGAAGDPKT
jgi:hypothetical protein